MAPTSPTGRYTLDLRQTGRGCTLVISGSYEEVLEEGLAHQCKAHESKEMDTERARATILSLMKLDHYDWFWPDDETRPRPYPPSTQWP